MAESARRRLAAVMFTDITGYTAMVQADEQAALKHVARYREVHNVCISRYNGDIIQFYGDGSLSIFESAIDAVRCAIEMQQLFREGTEVPVRIGIHLGDIVLKDDTVYGDGVNIASRIESSGVPGSILISSNIQKEITNHPDIQTKRLGAFVLKNVSKRVEIFAITHPGLVVPRKATGAHLLSDSNVRLFLVIALVMAAVYIAFRQIRDTTNTPSQVKTERIAVPLFVDYTDAGDTTLLSQMAADWILKELIETPNVNVVAFESATTTSLASLVSERSTAKAFASKTGAMNILKGEIYPVDDSLEFHAQIMNLESGEFIKPAWSSKCAPGKPMQCITQLASQIRGFWTSKDANVLSPPNFEAYKHYLRARSVWIENYSRAESELQQAINADPSFIDAYFLLMDLYYNNGRYADWQKMLETVSEKFPDLTARQQNLLELERSQLSGQFVKTYELYQDELSIDSKDQFINMSGMLYAMEYVNAPEVALNLFNLIPPEDQDLDQCKTCVDRFQLAIRAHLRLGNIKAAGGLAERLPDTDVDNLALRVRVYAAARDTAQINGLITRRGVRTPHARYQLNYQAAYEFALQEQQALKHFYAKRALRHLRDTLSGDLIRTLYLSEAYDRALTRIRHWITGYRSNTFVQRYAGLLYARLNMPDSALAQIAHLDTLRADFGYGWISYYQAEIYLNIGDVAKALDKLEQAFAEGLFFTDRTMTNDPDLIPLFDHPRFRKLLHPLEGLQ